MIIFDLNSLINEIESICIKPAKTIRLGFNGLIFFIITFSKLSFDLNFLWSIIKVFNLFFLEISIPSQYLSETTAAIGYFITPSLTALMIAFKFDPLPEIKTTIPLLTIF